MEEEIMKMKLFALLLAVVLVVGMIPVAALATTDEACAPDVACLPGDCDIPCTHVWDAKYGEIAPTCEKGGWAFWYCDNCGIWLTWWPLCPTGHDYEGAVTKEPTCTEDGEMTYTCKNDPSHTYTEVIPALGHDLVKHEAQAPTCTEIGWEAYETCTRCDYTTYKELAPLGHTEEVIPAVAPTCTETGLTEGKKCSVCDAILVPQEVVPALGHKEEIIPAVAPTCTESGLTEGKKCSVCGVILVPQEVVPATGHDWDDGVITREPTAEKDGEKTYTCQNDPSHKKYEDVPYVAPEKDYDDVPKTGDNTAVVLTTISGVAMLAAVAVIFGKKRIAA